MKIGIVGTGFVGATAAYALIMRGFGSEIVLVDKDEKRRDAEVDDLLHAVPFVGSTRVMPGSYPDLAGSRIVILAAGVGQKPGETRLELLGRNAAVFEDIVPQVIKYAPEAIIVVATNPVDVMTHIAATIAGRSGRGPESVIGSGTTLDTARFRSLVASRIRVNPAHVHGYVLGEHGDSEVLCWSAMRVAGMSLDDYCKDTGICFNDDVRENIDSRVRNAAYRIIEGKGATYYGIGSALTRIVEAVFQDQKTVLTVCARCPDIAGIADTTVSMPHLLGARGIERTFAPTLSPAEQGALSKSASVIRSALDDLGGY